MKYTTTLKSALALTLGLVVGAASAVTVTPSDVQKYADTFDTYTAGQRMSEASFHTGTLDNNGYGWFVGSDDDESAISNRTDAAGNMLWLNTDASTLTNKFETQVATDLNDGIAAAGAYFESDIKFVASDDLNPGIEGGTDDAKFAIYAYCKDDGMPTNLVVYHAYYDTNNDLHYTNNVFASVDVDVTKYTKLRVEMKQMSHPASGDMLNVFSVKVGDRVLESDLAFDAYATGENIGTWFLTVEDSEGNSDNSEISALTFTGTGEVDNINVGVITETTTYAVDWTGSANVVVSNATEAIASSPTNLPACTLTFYPTEGNVITNVLVGGAAQPFDPASFVLAVSSDTNVVVLAGVQAAQPTVFSVATVGNATVTGDNGLYTISVPLGNGLSSVFVNGAAVTPTDNGDGTYSIDVSALTGNVNIVVATKKVRTPIGHKWWENPQVVGTTTPGLNNEGTYGLRYMNGKADFVAATGWNANRVVKGFDLSALITGNAEAIITNTHDNTAGTWGVAISPALNVLLVGADYNGEKLISYPLNASQGTMGTDAFVISTDVDTVHGLQDMEFTADNQYLYALDYETQYVYKFRVLNGLKSEGTNLVRVATYDFGGMISGFTVGQFQGGDVLYAMMRGDGTVKYIDTAAAEPVATQLVAGDADIGGWGDVNVSATDTATPRITIFKCKMGYDTRALDVYTLNATGTAVVGEPLLSLDAAGLRGIGLPNVNTYGYSAFITDDEETLVFGYDNKLCAIQYVTPPPTVITVAQTIGAHGTSVSNGNFQVVSGTEVPLTITADQGYVIAQIVTNGAPVAAALGETAVTFDVVFSDAQGADNSVIATFAKADAWFVDPFIRNKFSSGITTENTQASALDEAHDVIAFGTAPGASTAGIVQYALSDVTNDFGKTTPYEYLKSQSNSHNAEYWGRSFAAVPSFEAIISCNYVNSDVVVSPYGGPWVEEGDVSYTVSMDMGESGLSVPHLYPITVNKAGTFLYGTDAADGNKIYKFAIVADAQDATKIGSLQYVASWNFKSEGGGDLKGIGVGTFNGNDVVYMGKNNSRGLWTLDVATGTLTKTAAAIDCEVYQLYTTGMADGTPRLVVAGGSNLFVFDLDADGTLLAATPVFKQAITTLTYSNNGSRFAATPVSDDSRIVLANYGAGGLIGISVVECKPANLIVRGTFDQGVTADDRSVAFGAAASETFTAPAGATITAVTVNGVAQAVAEGATSYTYENAELTEYVYVNITAVVPTYTINWTGSQNVDVTIDGEAWDDGTIGIATNGAIVTFTAYSSLMVTNVAGEAYGPASTYNLTVNGATNIVVLAGVSQPIGRIKPEWAANADTQKFWDWVDDNNVSDYASVDYTTEYLLNTAVGQDPAPEIKITSIEVGATTTTIEVRGTVGRGMVNFANLNGVLNLAVGSSVTALTPKAIPPANLDASVEGVATITIPNGDGCFFRARVDFEAPQASLTTAE